MATKSDTRNKLDEARFFLALCEETRHLQEFNYYLSACVGAARAVTWIMASEYDQVDGWRAWFDARAPSPAEARLMRQMSAIRNKTQKQSALKSEAAVQIRIPPDLVTDELRARMAQWKIGTRFKYAVIPVPDSRADAPIVQNAPFPMPEGLPKDAIVGMVEGFERHVAEVPDEDIVEALTRYVGYLEDLVNDCERAFSLP